MSCLQSLKIRNDKSEIQEILPLLFLQISHLWSLSHHPYMPNVDVSVVVIDLRAHVCWRRQGEGKEMTDKDPLLHEYREDPHLSGGSAIGEVGAWCMLLTAREAVFSFLRSRGELRKFLCVEMQLIKSICQCSLQLSSFHLGFPN